MRTKNRWRVVALACVVALAAGSLRAEKPTGAPLDRKALDKQVYDTLKEVINQGAAIYNPPTSDVNGCYRLYEGALMTLRPLLDHRPDLQKAIDAGLQRARANPQMAQRAFDLRAVIDKVRADTNPNPKAAAAGPGGAKTLWDRLGGEENVRKVVDDFVGMAATDPKIDFFRRGKFKDVDVPQLKQYLVEFVSMATGGPLKYKGRSMKEVHKGMDITDEQFDASAVALKKALEKNAAKPEDVDAVLKAVEGTRKDIVESKKETTGEKTLWDRLGGEENVKKVVHDFVVLASKDEKVDFTRKGKYPLDEAGVAKLEKSLVDFVSMATGGPRKYTGKSMKEVHAGMKITDAEFDASVADLKKALENNGAKAEDVKAVLDAVETTRKDIVEK